MFSLVSDADVHQQRATVSFNTDSIFDLMTGTFVKGFDQKWYLNGGLGPSIAGIQGRPQCFKSAFAASLSLRLSSIYDSQLIAFDSEDALTRDLDRMVRMAGDHATTINNDYIVPVDAKNKYDLESMREMIRDLGEKKKALGKDALVTTPFLDPKTNERLKVYRPSCILIDSYTECFSREEESLLTEKGLDDGRSKTLSMLDSNKKTIILRNLSRYAAEYGIEIVASAHYGSKLNLDPYGANPKFLQWSNQNDSPKSVGSKWGFLTSPLALVNSITKLQDDAKQCKYKLNPQTAATDLSEIIILIQRCKGNNSGVTHPFVVSQADGLLTDATDYNYLRSNKAFGFTGNNINHQCLFYPDTTMTRNSFRGICQKDHKLTRALQLAAQLCYIQSNWSSAGWAFPMNVDPKALCDFLYSDKNKMSVDRVLNSRSYWLPDELITDETPEYMSILDILEFCAQNNLVKQ